MALNSLRTKGILPWKSQDRVRFLQLPQTGIVRAEQLGLGVPRDVRLLQNSGILGKFQPGSARMHGNGRARKAPNDGKV